MSRLLIVGPLFAVVLDVFAIVDVVLVDRVRVRGVPKAVWIVLILLLPFIGAFLWFFVGRDRRGGSREPKVIAPDDDPAFLENLRRDEEQDDRIRRLEQELADLDDDKPKD